MQPRLLHSSGRQCLEKGLAKNTIWGKISAQVIIFAFLSAGLNNPQQTQGLSSEQCFVCQRVSGLCVCKREHLLALTPPSPTDKADRTDSHLPTECWVSTLSLSYFKAAGCQPSRERQKDRIERCFCFGVLLLPLLTVRVPLRPADLQLAFVHWCSACCYCVKKRLIELSVRS